MDKNKLIARLRDWYGIDVPALQAQAAQPTAGLAARIAAVLKDADLPLGVPVTEMTLKTPGGTVTLSAAQSADVSEALSVARSAETNEALTVALTVAERYW